MKPCSDECKPLCDFCRLFNFNGDKDGVYIERGYCVLHEQAKDPSDECNDFICGNYKVEKPS